MNILGVGIDIISPEKMKNALERWGDSFLERIFNPEELENIKKGRLYYQRLAARFAAKEAVIKALGGDHISFKDIIIKNLSNGSPICILKNNLEIEVKISLSHIDDYAVSVALAFRK